MTGAPGAVIECREFSGEEYRSATGAFATDVTVITTQGAEHPYGMAANAFSSVSLDPPLVLVCVISGTEGCASIGRTGVFAVNILTAAQEPLSRFFSSRDRPRSWEAFRQVPHRRGGSGAPILDGAAGFLDCRLASTLEAGDHTIVHRRGAGDRRPPGRPPAPLPRGALPPARRGVGGTAAARSRTSGGEDP